MTIAPIRAKCVVKNCDKTKRFKYSTPDDVMFNILTLGKLKEKQIVLANKTKDNKMGFICKRCSKNLNLLELNDIVESYGGIYIKSKTKGKDNV
jgi:hypothetical protein